MKKLKLLNSVIYMIVIVWSIILATGINGDMYGLLIRLSIIPILFVPQILEKMFSIKINIELITIYTIFIFLSHFLGSIVNLYHQIYWYDSFTHFLSGFVVSFFAFYLLINFKKYNPKSIFFNILFIFSVSLAVAELWEVFEFTSDKLFGKDAQNVLTTGVDDTMKDMIVAGFGSILFCISYLYEEINKKIIFIRKII